jgi:peptidoglycan/LPS O-acetylase OafA/YrhL
MLPVARSLNGELRGGWKTFLKRRARRILPPYYAALALSLLLFYAWAAWQRHVNGNFSDRGWYGDTSLASIGSHLLLLHNLHPTWNIGINGAMWSVATEWQIYFVFAFVLLVAWKKFGTKLALITAFALGLLAHFALPSSYNLDWACPWYLGLFGLGMTGAVVNFSQRTLASQLRVRIHWGKLSAFCSAALLMLFYFQQEKWKTHFWTVDLLVGLCTVCVIVAAARFYVNLALPRPVYVRVLENRWLIGLGKFSYSLYLVHLPILALLASIIWQVWHVPDPLAKELYFYLSVVCSVGVAYLFHLAVERRFMSA